MAGTGGGVEGGITAHFMEETGVVLMVDTTVDFRVEAGEAIIADIMAAIAEDSMEDPVIMADLLSASARHTISPLGDGTTLNITRNTTTTFLRQSTINPLLLKHLLLNI
jgi:hypothetical protein